MCDSWFSQLISEDEKNAEKKQENWMGLSSIQMRFSPQMKHCSSVAPQSSAIILKRSISNTVERKPTENISIHQPAFTRVIIGGSAILKIANRENPAIEACKDDMIDVVQQLLVGGLCDVNEIDSSGYSPLHYTAKYDYDDIAKLLINYGADPSIHNGCIRTPTPLQVACWFDSPDTAHLLIENGADVAACSRYGQLAIHCAAARSGKAILEELLIKGKANPNYKDYLGSTPLHIAANAGREEISKILLQYGSDMMLLDNDGNTPAHIAAREGHVTTLRTLFEEATRTGVSMRYLLESTGTGSCLQLAVKRSHIQAAVVCLQYGASTYSNAHDTSPPLHTACINGNIELVKLLIASGASVHADDIDGMTAILRASLAGHVTIVSYLIDQGARLEASGPLEPCPLMCAVKRGHGDVIKLLLTRGSSIKVRDSCHRTCLHIAVYSENVETLDVLLKHGGKVLINHQDKSELTPLHYAAINQNLKMIRKLLEFGADPTIYDEEEKIPLHHAAEAGDLTCVKELLTADKQSLHATDYRIRTPLYYAAQENKNDVVKYLIEKGARVNSRDDDRLTPLLAIAPGGCHKAAIMLLDNGAKIDSLSKNRATALNVASTHGNIWVIKVLLDRGARVDVDSSLGRGCLECAINGAKSAACMEIIKHKRWKEALKVNDSDGVSCMERIIDNFPEVAKLVMDKCVVTSSNVPSTDPDYSVTYNFEFVNIHPKERAGRDGNIYFGPQAIINYGAPRELLFHPLITELLDIKWNSLAKYTTYFSMLMFVIFIVNFTLYMVCFAQHHYNKKEHLYPQEFSLCGQTVFYLQSIGVCWFSLSWLLSHIYRILKERWNYFNRFAAIELCTLFACIFSSYIGELLGIKGRDQFGWGIIALLLCYFTLLFYIQTIFYSGIYVTMLFGVLKTLVKVMFTFVILLLAFAILFNLVLFSPTSQERTTIKGNDTNNSTEVPLQHAFGNIYLSSIKVIAMMVGDLEFTRFLIDREDIISVLAIFVFMAFCAFLPVVLMNLLIGLAVGDIDSVQKNAEIQLQSIKIEQIYSLEQMLPVAVLRYFYKPFIIKYPNRKAKGVFQKLKAVGNQMLKNNDDYEDLLEDQERDDIETMEDTINNLSKKMELQNKRIDKLIEDVQEQRMTFDKLANCMIDLK